MFMKKRPIAGRRKRRVKILMNQERSHDAYYIICNALVLSHNYYLLAFQFSYNFTIIAKLPENVGGDV